MNSALSLIWYPLFIVVGITAPFVGVALLYKSAGPRSVDFTTADFFRDQRARLRARSGFGPGALLLGLVAPGACVMTALPSLHPEYWLHAVASNGDLIVSAIDSYSKANGSPPVGLHDLVPTYIRTIPDSGYPAAGSWEYRVNGREWSLALPIGSGLFIDFDEFRCSPTDAPDAGYRPIIRSGKWLYLDE